MWKRICAGLKLGGGRRADSGQAPGGRATGRGQRAGRQQAAIAIAKSVAIAFALALVLLSPLPFQSPRTFCTFIGNQQYCASVLISVPLWNPHVRESQHSPSLE